VVSGQWAVGGGQKPLERFVATLFIVATAGVVDAPGACFGDSAKRSALACFASACVPSYFA
jgi:hypothetical protein